MTAHLFGSYETDITLAISWLRLNKAVSQSGDCTKRGLVYTCPVKLLKSRKEVADLLLSRFGRFVKVK
jgi:hypothetical protein